MLLAVRRFRNRAETIVADRLPAGGAIAVAFVFDAPKGIFDPGELQFMVFGQGEVLAPFEHFRAQVSGMVVDRAKFIGIVPH
ncbi:hypothetical protein HMSSN036_44470 [Paenibacillus macerans]|nr:hypothetical protein HMSSN036_44470 [Paenibacillus macerans]